MSDETEVKGPDETQFVRAPAPEVGTEDIPEDLKGPGDEWNHPQARAAAQEAR